MGYVVRPCLRIILLLQTCSFFLLMHGKQNRVLRSFMVIYGRGYGVRQLRSALPSSGSAIYIDDSVNGALKSWVLESQPRFLG
jgi:hypothetical protein